jgi:hypothetical protein
MPPRLVSRLELIEILNVLLRTLPGVLASTVGDVIRLRHAQMTEANWMPDFATTTSVVAMVDVYSMARYQFILKEEPGAC